MSSNVGSSDEELLQDVCDLHLHLTPDIYERFADEITIAKQARNAGYRALLFKNHHFPTAARAELVARSVPGIEICGGIVLNSPVGGINKHAVSSAIDFGAKMIWMPTFFSKYWLEIKGDPTFPYSRLAPSVRDAYTRPKVEGITILDSKSKLNPELYEIFDMIAQADIILSTGHLSPEESKILITEATNNHVKKIVFTHAMGMDSRVPPKPDESSRNPWMEFLEEIVTLGIYLEYDFNSTLSSPERSLQLMADGIKRFGATRCIITSDLGQPGNPNPIEGMRFFLESLIEYGVSEREIGILVKENPAKLLGID
jgi:hypothetical protein